MFEAWVEAGCECGGHGDEDLARRGRAGQPGGRVHGVPRAVISVCESSPTAPTQA